MLAQLPLELKLNAEATFASFQQSEKNAEVLACIKDMAQGEGENIAFIWGANGAGKTHLLTAACHEASNHNLSAVYLCLREPDLTPAALQNLEYINLICLDDIASCSDNKELQIALFHLFNKVRERGGKILFAADKAPRHLEFSLKDLKSRLTWGLVLQLHALDDGDKLTALQLKADCLGLKLDLSVAKYLLRHYSRNTRDLFVALDRLDAASMSQQRKLTIPFVKSVLG